MSDPLVPHPDLPPGNGRRASFDPATGAVHGSGMGAGGGQEGEDLDDGPIGGGGYPQTGGEGTDHAPGSKGPPHVKE